MSNPEQISLELGETGQSESTPEATSTGGVSTLPSIIDQPKFAKPGSKESTEMQLKSLSKTAMMFARANRLNHRDVGFIIVTSAVDTRGSQCCVVPSILDEEEVPGKPGFTRVYFDHGGIVKRMAHIKHDVHSGKLGQVLAVAPLPVSKKDCQKTDDGGKWVIDTSVVYKEGLKARPYSEIESNVPEEEQ